jgi:hypothetical protein
MFKKYKVNNKIIVVVELQSKIINKKTHTINIGNGTAIGQLKIEEGIIKMNPSLREDI